jgi:lycopene beta-cyclase
MKRSDYIILGAGASGLMLAYRMAADPFFSDKSIAIIDQEPDKGNDRTWCYWEPPNGEWDEVVFKSWSKVYFGSKQYKAQLETAPYQYKMIKSANFYRLLWEQIHLQTNISFFSDTIISIGDKGDHVVVEGESSKYSGQKVFNSTQVGVNYAKQTRYPVLQQHFVGWFVKLNSGAFDDSFATFMDFDLPQKGNTRFMYVLPTSPQEALFEYTLFSKDLLEKEEYEAAIKDYLEKKGYTEYAIVEKEYGSIPMTSYRFDENNTKNLLHIGTSGGWTKASTGYTFMNTSKKTASLVSFLKKEHDLTRFSVINKYWFYDLLMLDVLSKHNELGAELFSSLFNKTSVKTIFRFLDEESTLLEDLKIIISVPKGKFLAALWNRIF